MVPADIRKNKRYHSIAKARIDKIDYGEFLLKDISITGCRLESTVTIDAKPGTEYLIEIIPEKPSNIGNFELVTKSVWIQSGGYSTEIGFNIIKSPKGKLFERYVDYLVWRSSGKNQL